MEKEKEKLSLLAENQHYQQRDQTSRTVEVKKKTFNTSCIIQELFP